MECPHIGGKEAAGIKKSVDISLWIYYNILAVALTENVAV